MTIYNENGYSSRQEYLEELADMFGVDPQTVFALASILGESEDFDGLVTHLEDMTM